MIDGIFRKNLNRNHCSGPKHKLHNKLVHRQNQTEDGELCCFMIQNFILLAYFRVSGCCLYRGPGRSAEDSR